MKCLPLLAAFVLGCTGQMPEPPLSTALGAHERIAHEPSGISPEAKGFVSNDRAGAPPDPSGLRIPLTCTLKISEPATVEEGLERVGTALVPLPALVEGDQLRFWPQALYGSGAVRLSGYASLDFSWSGSELGEVANCGGELAPVALSALILGTVRSPGGTVRVEGCGGRVQAGADGGFRLQGEPGACAVRAVREVRGIEMPGAWAAVEAVSGVPVRVDLEVPDWEPAGLGVRLADHPLGLEILEVRPDTPASRAGLVEGEVVVAVDGQPTESMDPSQFVRHSVGAPGSLCSLTVTGAKGERVVTLTRQVLRVGG